MKGIEAYRQPLQSGAVALRRDGQHRLAECGSLKQCSRATPCINSDQCAGGWYYAQAGAFPSCGEQPQARMKEVGEREGEERTEKQR